MKILIIGPQGSGKGTQAEMLSKRLKLPAFSSGQIYREEIAKGTETGKIVDDYISKGLLVPVNITNTLMREKINSAEEGGGYILDGYPRNHFQLHPYLSFSYPDYVVLLEVNDEVSVDRLVNRIVCEKCGAIYHARNKPPKIASVCDACGGNVAQRKDDTDEAIRKRIEIYHSETEPIIKEFDEMGVLVKVNGDREIEEVAQEIVRKLGV